MLVWKDRECLDLVEYPWLNIGRYGLDAIKAAAACSSWQSGWLAAGNRGHANPSSPSRSCLVTATSGDRDTTLRLASDTGFQQPV